METNIHNNGKIDSISLTESGSIINNPKKYIEENRKNNPWISGSFYLFLFVIIISTLVVSAKLLPLYILPVIIVGSMLIFSIIGAFQLRNDELLKEKNFLELMALSFKYIPFLTKAKTNNKRS